MRKGDAVSAFMLLGAVIILMVAVSVTINFVYGGKPYVKPDVGQSSSQEQSSNSVSQGNTATECILNEECNKNPDGSECVNIADPHFPERNFNFCGCYLNSQCESTDQVQRSGVCGEENIC